MYADDIVLVSLSSRGMQSLLDICKHYADNHNLVFNSKKTQCMVFKPKGCKFEKPLLYIDSSVLEFYDSCKYLGTFIDTSGAMYDIKRQIRKAYGSSNVLITKFGQCSPEVKCMLFSSYCSNLYCPPFWYGGTISLLNKLRVAYNNSLRRLLKIPITSASDMFASLNIPSFDELLRKCIFSLMSRISLSNNSIIKSLSAIPVLLASPMYKWWKKLLF